MKIELLDFTAGARDARGLTVVIDVFRAFSVACYAFAQGAARVIPVGSVEDALRLKRAHPDFFSVGERYGQKLPGFDCGNSPTELSRFDLRGSTVIQTTHAGVQGLVAAQGADVVLTGALVNAGAICRYVAAAAPDRVSIVRMGVEARRRSDADDLCAELLVARLTRHPFDTRHIRARLRASEEARKFFGEAKVTAPRRDFLSCTALDRFDFVLRLESAEDGHRSLGRYPAPPGVAHA